MAYIVDQNDPNNLNQTGQGQNAFSTGAAPASGQVQLTSDAGVITPDGAAPQQGTPQASQKPTASGSFTNLQQYLNANQDQAGDLANKISKPLFDQQSQIQSSSATAKNQFEDQVKQGGAQAQPDLLSGLSVGSNPYDASTEAPKAADYKQKVTNNTTRDTPFENIPATPTTKAIQPQSYVPPGYTDYVAKRNGSNARDVAAQLNYGKSAQVGATYVPPASTPAPSMAAASLAPHYQDQQVTSSIDPTALSQAQKQALSQLLSGQYTGPSDIESTGLLQDARSKASLLQDELDNTQSEPGRYQLLQQAIAQPTYTSGQKSLDNALLEENEPARKILNDTRTKLSGVPKSVDDLAAAENALIAPAKQSAIDLQGQAKTALQQSIADRMSNLTARASYDSDLTKAQKQALQGQLQNAMHPNATDPQFLNDYKLLTGKDYDRDYATNHYTPLDYNVDPSQFVTDPGVATAAGVANPAEQAQIEALNQLLGQTNTALPKDASLGTYQPGSNFNRNDYVGKLTQNAADYNNSANFNKWMNTISTSPDYVTPQTVTNQDYINQVANGPEGISVGNGSSGPNYHDITNEVNEENKLRSQYGLPLLPTPPADLGNLPINQYYQQIQSLLNIENNQQKGGLFDPNQIKGNFA